MLESVKQLGKFSSSFSVSLFAFALGWFQGIWNQFKLLRV